MEKRKRGRPRKVRPAEQVPPTPANSPKTPEEVVPKVTEVPKRPDTEDKGVDIGGKEEMPKKVLSKEEAKQMLRDKLDKMIESKKKEMEKPGSVYL